MPLRIRRNQEETDRAGVPLYSLFNQGRGDLHCGPYCGGTFRSPEDAQEWAKRYGYEVEVLTCSIPLEV